MDQQQHAVGTKVAEQGREEQENRQILAEFMDNSLFEPGLVHGFLLCPSKPHTSGILDSARVIRDLIKI